MGLSGDLEFPAGGQALQPILADRLQHHQAWLLAFLSDLLQQALVKEGCNSLQEIHRRVADPGTNALPSSQSPPPPPHRTSLGRPSHLCRATSSPPISYC